MSWRDNRPFFNLLPGVYREAELSENPSHFLSGYFDESLMGLKDKLTSFYANYLDPDNAPSEWLDWLGQLCGFTDTFWNPSWEDSIKRRLIKDSFTRIWSERGTRAGIDYWFDTLDLATFNPDHDSTDPGAALWGYIPPGDDIRDSIYLVDYFRAGESSVLRPIGGEAYRYYIRLNESDDRSGYNFLESRRLGELNAPAWSDDSIGYRYWFVGQSQIGEATFDYVWEQTINPYNFYTKHNLHERLAVIKYLLPSVGVEPLRVSEIPTRRAGITPIPSPVYPVSNTFIRVGTDVSLHGSDELAYSQRVADLYAGRGKAVTCYEYAYAGMSLASQPIFDNITEGEVVERIVTLDYNENGIPTPSYTELDVQYESRPVFEILSKWLEADGDPLKCLALFTYMTQELGIPVEVSEVGTHGAAVGISPVPKRIGVSPKVALKFVNDATWTDDPLWQYARKMTEWLCRAGHAEVVTYDRFYAGISPVGQGVYDEAKHLSERTAVVSISPEGVLSVTYSEPNNPDPYPFRDIYELAQVYFNQNPELDLDSTRLGLTYYVLMVLANSAIWSEVAQIPQVRAGITAVPHWVGEDARLYIRIPRLRELRNDPYGYVSSVQRIARLTARAGFVFHDGVIRAGLSSVDAPIWENYGQLRSVTVRDTDRPFPYWCDSHVGVQVGTAVNKLELSVGAFASMGALVDSPAISLSLATEVIMGVSSEIGMIESVISIDASFGVQVSHDQPSSLELNMITIYHTGGGE